MVSHAAQHHMFGAQMFNGSYLINSRICIIGRGILQVIPACRHCNRFISRNMRSQQHIIILHLGNPALPSIQGEHHTIQPIVELVIRRCFKLNVCAVFRSHHTDVVHSFIAGIIT